METVTQLVVQEFMEAEQADFLGGRGRYERRGEGQSGSRNGYVNGRPPLKNELRAVLRWLAARTAGELVVSQIAADAELSRVATADYIGLLEALYLVIRLPGWASRATTRAKRRPKAFVVDTGLAADLCGAGEADFGPRADETVAGALLETFVLRRAWGNASPSG